MFNFKLGYRFITPKMQPYLKTAYALLALLSNCRREISAWHQCPLLVHFRLMQPVLPAGPCPLRSESDRNAALPRNVAMGQEET